MIFKNRLVHATLVKRYKRFLADVILEDGSEITVYCPNTGSMKSCSAPGSRVCISLSENKERKYPYTLEMIEIDGTWIGVNTGLTNHIVAEAIERGEIAGFEKIDSLKREVTVTKGTRLDMMVLKGSEKTYIEVKNCSLVEEGVAMFPDAVTKRGTKHLEELCQCAKKGHKAVIFYLVQRTDCSSFQPAKHIDSLYAETLQRVHGEGVAILAYQAEVSPESIKVVRQLPFSLG